MRGTSNFTLREGSKTLVQDVLDDIKKANALKSH